MGIFKLCRKVVNKFISKTFGFWQMLGFHVTPVYFYEPIPDTKKLGKDIWNKKSEMIGIDLNEQKQLSLLSIFMERYKNEYDLLNNCKSYYGSGLNMENSEFRSVDAEILYCMIRHFKPKRIFEIGSGYSTVIMARAIEKNREEKFADYKLTSIDPYPKKFIKSSMPVFFSLIEKQVQEVGLNEFDKLKENDMLFIDSSHMLKIGSDVQYEYLEILPRLNNGVLVHIHDIFLPHEYPKNWVLNEHLFFNEQYLLQAFLIFNRKIEILWGGSFMHLNHKKRLKNAFGSYDQYVNWPGSFWMRTIC